MDAYLAPFDSNCPPFFDRSERADHEQFPRDPSDRGDHFVLERDMEVGACEVVGLRWRLGQSRGRGREELGWPEMGMVRSDLHGQGLGAQFTDFRLGLLRARPEVNEVCIDTSQLMEGYYARHGFVTVQRRPDGFAPGPDEIRMILKLPRS